MVVGIAWYFVKVPVITNILTTGMLVPFWRSFLVTFAGAFGILLFLSGLILAWLGYDEIKLSGGE
jgi:ABC-type spermidine/putrescine transport system permease subunit I